MRRYLLIFYYVSAESTTKTSGTTSRQINRKSPAADSAKTGGRGRDSACQVNCRSYTKKKNQKNCILKLHNDSADHPYTKNKPAHFSFLTLQSEAVHAFFISFHA